MRGDVGNNEEVNSSVEELGHVKKVKIHSTKLRDYVTHNSRKNKVSSPCSSVASLSLGTPYLMIIFPKNTKILLLRKLRHKFRDLSRKQT